MMKTTAYQATERGALDLPTYLIYRMGTAVFEGVFGAIAWFISGNELDLIGIFAVVATTAITTLVLWRRRHRPMRGEALAALFLFDLMSLTVFLGLTGGPSNPFSVLCLVQVTLASMVLHGRLVWAMTLSASLLYGVLFWWHDPLPAALGGHDMGGDAMSSHDHHGMHHHDGAPAPDHAFSAHLQGMWMAFTITAVLLTALVTRVTRALGRAELERARTARLLGLTTLAAGAAHELGGPLATIKVAAGELRHLMHHGGEPGEMIAETEVIDAELGRARDILDRMMLDAGQLKGEGLVVVTLSEFVSVLETRFEVVDELTKVCRGLEVRWPVDAITTMCEQLVKNAHEAMATRVIVRVSCVEPDQVVLRIEDDGRGLDPQAQARSGEPFFTTKETGEGMGLGIFLATSLCEQLGGMLTLANRRDHSSGCVVTITLPSHARDSG